MAFFEIEILNLKDFLELIFRFGFNFITVTVIVKFLYYRASHRKDYFFTYILISTVIFLMCFLLENVKLELGFALGLFAIFGIIRYRTRQIPIKEMTYLFVVIGISVINALSNSNVSYAELVFTNLAIVFVTYILERLLGLKHEAKKTINYEKIELIKPNKRDELLRDLEERTGIKINRVEIGEINFLKDSAKVSIYYFQNNFEVNQADV
ncbi:DUF4956 domain-containing protein [Fulvivirgaceae bacterium BMA10]|uniref:DUF4956 domain-containing protein n=1 Tax=Splendidivirga corallicola TaxID=3051826 RepID=A0ABT8KRE1_9BACT|nr:DUF4956 domain-containing protein [Fulvivirgaceae bacterium BMA10]